MSTTIEWTQRPDTKGETWNPTTGCNKVSAGCKNCYAEVMHRRLLVMQPKKYDRAFSAGVVTHADTLTIPLGWKKPRTVFVNSMSDLFHADVPFAFIDQVFAIMALTPQHTYQILTKRPERMAEYMDAGRSSAGAVSGASGMRQNGFPQRQDEVIRAAECISDDMGWCHSNGAGESWPLPNVWLGTSVENQATADERIPHLLRCPAAVRFLSCEPLLGPVDLTQVGDSRGPFLEGHHRPLLRIDALRGRTDISVDLKGSEDFGRIHWVITGGESGQHARPMHPDWARSLRDQCAAAGVPFFFKQWGTWLPAGQGTAKGIRATMVQDGCEWDAVGKHASGNLLDGRSHVEYPTPTSSRGVRDEAICNPVPTPPAQPAHELQTASASEGLAVTEGSAQGAEQLTPQ